MTRQDTIELYNLYSRRLFNTSYRIVRSAEAAQEIMHDTLLKLVEKDVVLDSEGQRAVWLSRTCIRKSLDWLRRRKTEAQMLEGYAMTQDEMDDGSFEEEVTQADVRRVRDAILGMPPPYSLVLNLILLEGLDYDEISELMKVKEATLRAQFSRGKVKLIEILKNDRH